MTWQVTPGITFRSVAGMYSNISIRMTEFTSSTKCLNQCHKETLLLLLSLEVSRGTVRTLLYFHILFHNIL